MVSVSASAARDGRHVTSAWVYGAVLAALLALTAVTLGVSLLELPPAWHLAIGMAIAVVKAALVVLFFMHALDSPRLTAVVIVVAAMWLSIQFSLTLVDYLTRGHIPNMPGH